MLVAFGLGCKRPKAGELTIAIPRLKDEPNGNHPFCVTLYSEYFHGDSQVLTHVGAVPHIPRQQCQNQRMANDVILARSLRNRDSQATELE